MEKNESNAAAASEDVPAKSQEDAAALKLICLRHAEERIALKKRNERIKSSIPKKDRVGRQRAAEDAAEDEKKLTDTHAAQLGEHGVPADELQQYLDALTIAGGEQAATASAGNGSSDEPRGESKAARRRRKKAEKDAEATRRVQEEKAGMGPSAKSIELAAINEQLAPKHLRIHPIAADGHCLYGAIAHQMQLTKLAAPVPASVSRLRETAAEHLRAHEQKFMPFIDTVANDPALFQQYCHDLQHTTTWGGQLELNVLAQILSSAIEVYAAGMPVVCMGPQFDHKSVLRVSFHRQYLGLGEHYNSVVPQNVEE